MGQFSTIRNEPWSKNAHWENKYTVKALGRVLKMEFAWWGFDQFPSYEI